MTTLYRILIFTALPCFFIASIFLAMGQQGWAVALVAYAFIGGLTGMSIEQHVKKQQ